MQTYLFNMRKLLLTMLSILFGFASGNAQNQNFRTLDVSDFETAIANDDIVRLDVRTAEEYAEGHISGAINIDVLKDDFLKRASELPKDKDIALYCRSGNRSKKAAKMLSDNGYRVIELGNGYNGWVKAGKAVTKEEVDLFITDSGTTIYVYCIKHGTFKMRIGDKWVYIDPVSDNIPPATDFSSQPKADIILITHEHHDHLDDKAILQLSKDDTRLITNSRCSELLGGKGEVMKNGDKVNIFSWTIEAVPAYNYSADKQQFHPKGRDNGYIMTIEGFRIYIAGDTEDIDEMKDIRDIDVAFLPCNLPFTMTPSQTADAAKTIMPRVLFPYHYGDTDIQQVVKLLQGSNIDVRIRQYR